MDELQGRRLRRLRAQRPETAETVLPDLPRVGALDALLREVDGLRLTLETDLTLAASAVEAGAPDVASDILDSDRDALKGFEKRALGHVAELSAPLRRWKVPAAPFVAAAAVAGFLIGVVPHATQGEDSTLASASLEAPSESLSRLVDATRTGQTAEAVSAAQDLHAQLQALVANADTDPQAAAAALALLRQEQAALVLSIGDSLAVKKLLVESKHLTSLLEHAIDKRIVAKVGPTATLPPVLAAPSPAPKPTQSPSSKPTTKATAKPTQSPSSKPTTPQPSASPTPSPEGPLPPAPGFH